MQCKLFITKVLWAILLRLFLRLAPTLLSSWLSKSLNFTILISNTMQKVRFLAWKKLKKCWGAELKKMPRGWRKSPKPNRCYACSQNKRIKIRPKKISTRQLTILPPSMKEISKWTIQGIRTKQSMVRKTIKL